MENYGRAGQATDDSMVHVHSCWITKATKTHSKYITAFPLQPSLQERPSLLRYRYTAGLVSSVL